MFLCHLLHHVQAQESGSGSSFGFVLGRYGFESEEQGKNKIETIRKLLISENLNIGRVITRYTLPTRHSLQLLPVQWNEFFAAAILGFLLVF